jgi:hypothetical protein
MRQPTFFVAPLLPPSRECINAGGADITVCVGDG